MLLSNKAMILAKRFIETFKPSKPQMDFSEPKSIQVSMVEVINGKAYRVIPCGRHGAILERL